MVPKNVKTLKGLRQHRGLSQEEVAEKLNISFGFVSLVERGLRTMTADRMAEFAKLYNVTLNDIQKLRQQNEKLAGNEKAI